MTTPYKHEPFTNFGIEENRKAFEKALETVNNEWLGQSYPLVIDGERYETEDKIVSINPANKEEVVGTVSKALRIMRKRPFRRLRKRLKLGDTQILKKERLFYSARLPMCAAKA